MEGGSQSGTCKLAIPLTGIMSLGSTTPVSPFSARAIPSMPMAALSARSRWDGVSASKRTRERAAAAARLAQLRRLLPRVQCVERGPIARQLVVNGVSLFAQRLVAAARDFKRSPAPGHDRLHETEHRALQHRRMITQVGRLADRGVDDRIERDDATQQVASKRLELKEAGAGGSQNNRPTHP